MVSSTAGMDWFRRRYLEAKQADDARNTLIEDLLQKVDDMQKTMERNAFVLVLIDGDNMNFLNDLVKQGMDGGDEAAKRLRKSVFDYLRYDESFKHDHRIVIKVYANLRGLSKTYATNRILPNTTAFSDFVLGFNKAHPLCDFIDAGNQKEAADTKLREVLSLYLYNVHCKQIIFGASADNAYPSFLSSFSVDTDVSSRIRLLKGPPFSFEFKQIISRFRWTEFKNVFRSEFITHEAGQHHTPHKSDDWTSPDAHAPWPWTPRNNASSYATNLNVRLPILEDRVNEPRPFPTQLHQIVSGGYHHQFPPQYGQEPIQDTAPSEPAAPPRMPSASERPKSATVEDALIRRTNERLQESPKALDFGVVKQRVEQELGLLPDFWDDEQWFLKSKNIIKMAVEEWVEQTDSPPPKNATWMLKYFTSGQSPSAVMKDPASEKWRTRNP